jgi:hypothetical protein
LTLKGRVLTPDKTPVDGATVWLDQDRRVQKKTTGQDGSFCFKDVQIMRTDVVAFKEGMSLAGKCGLPVNDMEFDLTLGPAASVKIRVTDKDFNPVPGARIRSMNVSDEFNVAVEDLVDHGFAPLRANDQGGISIDCVPLGGFLKLVVGQHRFADSNVAYLPAREKRQDVQLYDGVPVRGRVTAQGKALALARVSIFESGTQGQRELASAVTDPEGFYSARVEPGGYMVTARHADYAAPVPVNLDASKADGAVVDLEMPVTRTITGKILLPGDKPCPGSRVAFSVNGTVYEECITDGNGAFLLRVGSTKGLLMIVAPPGYRTLDLPQVPVDMGEALVAELPVTQLKELPVIKGRITIPEDQGPVGKVLFESLDAEPPVRFLSDENGAFEIRLGYQPEKNMVTFRAEHALRFLRKDFKINLDQAGEVELRLEPFEPDLGKRPPIPGRNNLSKLLGKPAPKMQCSDWINSPTLDLEKLRGKVVVLTMWGGFDDSPFATNRINQLRAVHDLYEGVADDVAIITVHDGGNDADEIAEYVRRFRLRFPVGRDADPFVTFVNYGVNFIPQTVLIDKRGELQFDQVEGRLLELVKSLRGRQG